MENKVGEQWLVDESKLELQLLLTSYNFFTGSWLIKNTQNIAGLAMLEVHVCLYWTSTSLHKYYRILSSGLFKQARFCWKCIFDFTKFCTLWILYGWPLDKSKLEVHQCLRVCDTQHLPAVAMQRWPTATTYVAMQVLCRLLLAQFNICLLLMQYCSKTTKNYFLVTARKICTTSKKENKREPNLQQWQRCRQSSVYNRKF